MDDVSSEAGRIINSRSILAKFDTIAERESIYQHSRRMKHVQSEKTTDGQIYFEENSDFGMHIGAGR